MSDLASMTREGLPMSTFIDLSYDIEEGMTTFNAPWHPQVSIKQLGRIGIEGRETREIILGTHTGTHIDAPLHFCVNGKAISSLSLATLIGPVTVIDFSHLKENESVEPVMLEKFVLTRRMIFKFGWGRFWGSRRFYQNYPFFSLQAAQHLIDAHVELVGMDTASPDDSRINLTGSTLGGDLDSPVHKIFLRNNVILVEYLAHLDKVTEYEGWRLIAMPIKIKGADGAPARVCLYKD